MQTQRERTYVKQKLWLSKAHQYLVKSLRRTLIPYAIGLDPERTLSRRRHKHTK